jgi:hypothetical protein
MGGADLTIADPHERVQSLWDAYIANAVNHPLRPQALRSRTAETKLRHRFPPTSHPHKHEASRHHITSRHSQHDTFPFHGPRTFM